MDSDKKQKRAKIKKSNTKTHASLRRLKKPKAVDPILDKRLKKLSYIGDKPPGSKTDRLANSSLQSTGSQFQLFLLGNGYNLSTHLGRHPTLDITSLKKNIKNFSPSKITDFYEPSDEFTTLISYQNPRLQSTFDFRGMQELRNSAHKYRKGDNSTSLISYKPNANHKIGSSKIFRLLDYIGDGSEQKYQKYIQSKSFKQLEAMNSSRSTTNCNVDSLINHKKRESDYMDLGAFKEKLNKTISMKNLDVATYREPQNYQ